MPVTGKLYGNVFKHLALKKIDWVADTIKLALCTSAYVPDQDAHEFFTSVTNELPTGGGYTAGGITLTGKSVTYDAPTNETRLLAAAATIDPATFTTRIGVIYLSTGVAATSVLCGWVDFGADMMPTNSTFTVTFNATGALKFTAA